MKFTLLLCVLAGHALAAQPVLVRVSAETLADLQKRDPMIRLEKPAAGEAKIPRPANQSIIKQSTILHDGRHWTLVPNDAIVFQPQSLSARVNAKPLGTLLPWSEFLIKNHAWISTHEVSFEQAAGTEELPAEKAIHWAKQDKIVVAVHQRGPISVKVAPSNTTAKLSNP